MRNNLAAVWPLAPRNPMLSSDEVHVWQATLDHPPTLLRRLREVLMADELAKASQFRRPQDREHFVACRGLLRDILSRYLGVEPRELQFDYYPFGKPMLVRKPGHQDIHFSVSRSSGVALYAVTAARETGVDVEKIRMDFPHEPVARRWFSPPENAMLAALPENSRQRAFFNCWTRKEAYAKARGTGLSLPFDAFAVCPVPSESGRWEVSSGFADKGHWSLWDLVPHRGLVGAVAVEGCDCRLACWRWTE